MRILWLQLVYLLSGLGKALTQESISQTQLLCLKPCNLCLRLCKRLLQFLRLAAEQAVQTYLTNLQQIDMFYHYSYRSRHLYLVYICTCIIDRK